METIHEFLTHNIVALRVITDTGCEKKFLTGDSTFPNCFTDESSITV